MGTDQPTKELDESKENTYENYLRTSGYSLSTMNIYLTYYRQFKKRDISQTWVNNFIRSHNNHVSRAFLKSCLHDWMGWTDLRIIRSRGRKEKPLTHWITHKQYIQLIRDPQMRDDLRVLIMILYQSGLRIVEVVGDRFHKALTPESIDFENNEIHGIGKFNKEFCVDIKPQTTEALRKMIDVYGTQKDQPIFEFQERRAQMIIKQEGKRILGRNIHPHMFRHGLATYLIRQGYSIQDVKVLLRHENLNTVEKYTHIDQEEVRKKLQRLGY